MFSFSDKLFGLVIKDIEAMDPSILKGEQGSGKKDKVASSSKTIRGVSIHSSMDGVHLPSTHA